MLRREQIASAARCGAWTFCGATDIEPDLNILFQRLGLALAMGFLVGVERGWKQRDQAEGMRAAGVRTYSLVGLLGGVLGASAPYFGVAFLAAMALAFAAAFIFFEARQAQAEDEYSATSAIAGLLVFALGAYAAVGNVYAAAAAAVAMTALLAFKSVLHGWLQALSWQEIRSALIIMAATFIALPLTPQQPIDPWGVINLRALWLLTIIIAAASFAGYVALRTLGPSAGLMAAALAGAIVSSTAVTADLARRVRGKEIGEAEAAGAASLATAVMFVRVGLLASIASAVAWRLAPAAAAGALGAAAAAFALKRFMPQSRSSSHYPDLHSPLDLLSVGRFALLLGALSVLAKVLSSHFGDGGILAFAATAGFADVDVVTISVSRQAQSDLAPALAAAAALIAASANMVFKLALAFFAGNWRFAALFAGVSALAFALAWAAFILLPLSPP